MGFGDALLKAEKFVLEKNFLLHAGDLYLPDYSFFKLFLNPSSKYKMVGLFILFKFKLDKSLKFINVCPLSFKNLTWLSNLSLSIDRFLYRCASKSLSVSKEDTL